MRTSKKDLEAMKVKYREQMNGLFELIYKDAVNLGFGFLIIRHSKKYGVKVYRATWLEVEKALNELGVVGPFIK